MGYNHTPPLQGNRQNVPALARAYWPPSADFCQPNPPSVT
jgi:hypothetical protein